MGGMISGLKVLTSVKKILFLMLLGCLGFVVNGVLYFVLLSRVVGGMLSVVSLSFYVFFTLIMGM